MPRSKQVKAAGYGRRPRVLVVDDVSPNRLLLGLYCDQLGLDHEDAENGRQAVEAAASGRFDLVLMDILMPGMDGIAATKLIRALPGAISRIPIIAVTTAAAPGEAQRYLSFGMDQVVAKPIVRDRLAGAISEVLAQHPPGYEAVDEDRSAA